MPCTHRSTSEQGIYLRAISVTKAGQAQPGFKYDEAQDAMVNTTTGEVYPADNNIGNFVSAKGEKLNPGWKVGVGFKNYTKLFTDPTVRERFLPILLWTFAFAILTTVLNFGLGLILAMVMNERRMRGQKIYRLLLIVPYGLPFILTALIWKAMLNTDFGLINQILGVNVPWLENAWLARFSILMVNLWAGFPYFFLVCSGALTSIPADLKEAAFVDGASSRHAFRTVVLPLLLVATAPLLVTTFAFNFNNFNLIIPAHQRRTVPRLGQRRRFHRPVDHLHLSGPPSTGPTSSSGLASAIAMLIFVIVGSMSSYGFRLTRKLEEIGR